MLTDPTKDTSLWTTTWPDINQMKYVPWDNPLLEEASMAITSINGSNQVTYTPIDQGLQSIPQEHVITSKPPAIIAGEGLMTAILPDGSMTISLNAPIKGADLNKVKEQVIEALTTTAEGKKVTPSVAALQAQVTELTTKNQELLALLTTTQKQLHLVHKTVEKFQNQINQLKTAMQCHTHNTNLIVNSMGVNVPTSSSYDSSNYLSGF